MKYFLYTNINDFQLYLIYGAISPSVAKLSNYFGGLLSIKDNYIFVTSKDLSEACVNEYCQHRNVFGIRLTVDLEGYASEVYFLNSNGEIEKNTLQNYQNEYQGFFVTDLISIVAIIEIKAYRNSIINNTYSDFVFPYNLLISDSVYGTEVVTPQGDLPINNSSLYFLKIKAAYLCCCINYNFTFNTLNANIDEYLYEIVNDNEITYDGFIKKNFDINEIPYMKDQATDSIIFKNIDYLLINAINKKNVELVCNQLTDSDYKKANIALVYLFINNVLEQSSNGNVDIDFIIKKFLQYLNILNIDENVISFYQNISFFLSVDCSVDTLLVAYSKSNLKEQYIAIISLKIVLNNHRIDEISNTISFYKLKISFFRLIYFMFGFLYGYENLNYRYKNFDYLMIFSEIKASKMLKINSNFYNMRKIENFFAIHKISKQKCSNLFYPIKIYETDISLLVKNKLAEILSNCLSNIENYKEIIKILLSLKRRKSDDQKLCSLLFGASLNKKKKSYKSKKTEAKDDEKKNKPIVKQLSLDFSEDME